MTKTKIAFDYRWLSSVLRPRQHSIGHMGDGFCVFFCVCLNYTNFRHIDCDDDKWQRHQQTDTFSLLRQNYDENAGLTVVNDVML